MIIIAFSLRWYFNEGKNILAENKKLVEREWADDELIKHKLRTQGDRETASLKNKIIHGIIHFDRILPIYEKYLRMLISTKKRRVLTLVFTLLLFFVSIAMPILGFRLGLFSSKSVQQ